MSDPIKVGLVGCGRIAKRHADLLSQHQINGAVLSAVCDVKKDRAKEFGEKYKVPWYVNMHDMMEKEPISLVSVLTESGTHAEVTVELARYKKHILVEKPMALTLDSADEMIQACAENNIKLFVVKQNRFNVPVLKLREAIEQGRLGNLFLGTIRVRWCRHQAYYDNDPWRGTWKYDGGVFSQQASHHVDMLEWMMGDVESVFAKSAKFFANIEAEDTGIALLKFKNGAFGIIEATTAARPDNIEGSLSILGSNGIVEIGGFAVNEMKLWRFEEELPEDKDVLKKFSVNPPDVYGFGHKAYYEDVINSISNNTKALVDRLEGRKSLELISAIYESVETGKEVFLRFKPKECKLGL